MDVAPSMQSHPWAATAWEGEVGLFALFRVRGKASHYQKLRRVTPQMEGRMTQLPVRSVPAFPSAEEFVPHLGDLSGAGTGKWQRGCHD